MVARALWILGLAACATNMPETDLETDSGGSAPPIEVEQPAIVAADGSGDYLDLGPALEAGEDNILVRAGTYRQSGAVVFERPGVRVRGEQAETVRFVQDDAQSDLFVVRADDVEVSSVTLDTRAHGQAAFVQAGASEVTLADSIVLGGDRIFTVYFAGPAVQAGEPTMEAYRDNELSVGNRMIGNRITSAFRGDSVVFALQTSGEVRGNTIAGGMLSLFMNREVVCEENLLVDSQTNGLFVSLPSQDVVVSGNTVMGSAYSAIVLKPQLEHPPLAEPLDSTGIVIAGNDIESELNGIEADGTSGEPSRGRLRGLAVRENEVRIDDFSGIYLLRVDEPLLEDNAVTFDGSDTSRRGVEGRPTIASVASAGIYLDIEVDRARIERNRLTRTSAATDPSVMQNAVVLSAPSVTEARIAENVFKRSADAWYHSPCTVEQGASDRDGVYDLTDGDADIAQNRCEDQL